MPWEPWRITWELQSPMHIGWRTLGNVKYTRPYVTGRAFWGALTARLQRDVDQNRDYASTGEFVHQNFVFLYGYFHTADNPLYRPWESDFDYSFLSSYASTALENGRNAESGSLHETEMIMPRTRGAAAQTCLTAVFFAKKGISPKWQGLLSHLVLGAERAYGWGRVKALPPTRMQPSDYRLIGAAGWDLEGPAAPVLHWPLDRPIDAHLLCSDRLTGTGEIEPLVGRLTTTSNGHAGAEHSPAVVCWTPGSLVSEAGPAASTVAYRVGPFGIWSLHR